MPYLSLLHPEPLSLWQSVRYHWATELIRVSQRWPLCIGPWIVYFFTGDEPCYLKCLLVPNKLFPIQLFKNKKILKQANFFFGVFWSKYSFPFCSDIISVQFSLVPSRVWLFVTTWTAALQASLTITNSRNFLKLMSIELVMPSNHLILCHPLLILPSILPSIRIFSSESVLCIRWPK